MYVAGSRSKKNLDLEIKDKFWAERNNFLTDVIHSSVKFLHQKAQLEVKALLSKLLGEILYSVLFQASD